MVSRDQKKRTNHHFLKQTIHSQRVDAYAIWQYTISRMNKGIRRMAY